MHQPTCRAFDNKGPDGSNSKPGPMGMLHSPNCAKLIKGEGSRKAGKRRNGMDNRMKSLRKAQPLLYPAMLYPFY